MIVETKSFRWSTYNTLFRSKRFNCFFLFNSLTSTLIKLDEPHFQHLQSLSQDASHFRPGAEDDFHLLLLDRKVLVHEGEEQSLTAIRQRRRDAIRLNSTHLGLTICPTLTCNFRCPYCFEGSQGSKIVMSCETIDRLFDFIASFTNAKSISISWFGGEPTLSQAFQAICHITERAKRLELAFTGAELTTNGYHLNERIIGRLNGLNVTCVQVTLDGPQQVHDSRRFLATGKGTFERILTNIGRLLDSQYRGNCVIRVNVDRRNKESFFALRQGLVKRFPGKKLTVYAGRVEGANDECSLCMHEWSQFMIRLYRDHGLLPPGAFFPSESAFDICTANTRNDFVIGPEGEIYKCGKDVGRKDRVVGSIHEESCDFITNRSLVDMYSSGTDPYLDEECLGCKALPICGGGCPNNRLQARACGVEDRDFCSPYRNALIMHLEEYYDTFLAKEICQSLLQPGYQNENLEKGYRVIQTGMVSKL